MFDRIISKEHNWYIKEGSHLLVEFIITKVEHKIYRPNPDSHNKNRTIETKWNNIHYSHIVPIFTIRSSSVANIEVVNPLPRLLGKLQQRNVAKNVFTTISSGTISPHTSLTSKGTQLFFVPPSMTSSSSIPDDVYLDVDRDSLFEGEEKLLTLSLLSSSPVPANFVEVVLLCDAGVSFDDWACHLMSSSQPDMYFSDHFAEKCVATGNNNGAISSKDSAFSEIPFTFNDPTISSQSWTAVVTPSYSSTTVRRQVEPTFRAAKNLRFENLKLLEGETLRLPIHCHGTKGWTDCTIL